MLIDTFIYYFSKIPGTDKGGYFGSNANLAGFEHRAIMQVCFYFLLPSWTLNIFLKVLLVNIILVLKFLLLLYHFQVIVLCLVGIYKDDVIRAFVLFLQWYKVATRSPKHTQDSLAKMDELMIRYVLVFFAMVMSYC